MANQTINRFLALALALALFTSAFGPVTAQASEAGNEWIELLETATVNDSGSNLVTFSGTSSTVRIYTPQYMRLTKIDLVLTHPAGASPTSVSVSYNGTLYTLTKASLDNYTTRFYGSNIPNTLYKDVWIQINKSGTTSMHYQFLSCKVSSLETNEFDATAYAQIGNNNEYCPFAYTVSPSSEADNINYAFQFPIIVEDWRKYDKLVFSGSVDKFALNSVRCTIDGLGLPYEISYTVSNTAGSDSVTYEDSETLHFSYDDSYFTSTEGKTFETEQYSGKILFTLTVDVSAVDRENVNYLYVYFTGLGNDYNGYTIQILGVTGHIYLADITDASMWEKVKAFFTGLFDTETEAADQFNEQMQETAEDFGIAHDQLDSVTKPSVDEVPMDPGQLLDPAGVELASDTLGAIFESPLVMTPLLITLTCSIAAFIIF